jgi:quinoprotein glucose dehydrogenase
MRLRLVPAIGFGALFVTAIAIAQRPAPGSIAPGSVAAGEWRHYASDAASTKYSPLTQIARENVGSLEIAWRWSSPDNDIVKANPTSRPGAFQDTPIMVNGVLYTTSSLANHQRYARRAFRLDRR